MSRLLYDDLDPEDVLLADLAYGSYMDLALVQPPGADAVFRSSPCPSDGLSRSAKNWGLATIKSSGTSPSTVPSTLCESELVAVPESLTVREVCLRLTRRGNRFQQIIVVTTLLDAKRAQCSTFNRVVWIALAGSIRQSAPSQNDIEVGKANG